MTKPKAGALSLSEQGRRGAFVVHTGRRAAGRVRNGEDPNEVMGDMVAETVQRAHELG
ncbi:MAG TPA: hypothetical protein VEW42_02785 [Candidatus Eisenbacteria bacterium]|nr:hypothetical protein [Candidatus Eisenbacteria bacterium]